MSRSSNPQSELTAAFSYQLRPDYERSLWQIRYGVHWVENVSKGRQIYLDFPEISVIKIAKSEGFQNILDQLNDDFLSASYNDHLIVAAGASMVTNSQRLRKQRQYHYNRLSVDFAGNTLRAFNKAFGGTQTDGGDFTIAGIQYAQFVKIEEDFRLYRRLNETNTTAFRLHPGVGISYGNLKVLPFERSFFAGGSNGIRAWQARTLGPGSFRDTTAIETFNNIGDVRLEASMEYRFKLTSMFEAALFLDAGNVWLMRPDALRPGADFTVNRFLGEIAVGGGLGIRLDFDYFLLRFDFGLQLKDPSKKPGERWLWQDQEDYLEYLERFLPPGDVRVGVPLQFNLGIGYPF